MKSTVSRDGEPNKMTLIMKILILLVLLIMPVILIIDASIIIEREFKEDENSDVAERLGYNSCKDYYEDEKYDSLYRVLRMYRGNSEESKVYWEMINGYIDYLEYEKWSGISEGQIQGSDLKTDYYRQKIMDNYNNCKYESNKIRLGEYLDIINEQQK